MIKHIIGCSVLLLALMGCTSTSTISELERGQKSSAELLEQQSRRMEMQEEYLAQLAESQLEVAANLVKVSNIITHISESMAHLQDSETGASANASAPATDAADGTSAASKEVVGRNEWVWLEPLNRNFKARVDTGALSSSLSATELQPFERDGREWIRFRVPDEEHVEGGEVYETQLIKYIKIRQTSTDKLERRPVVRLKVRMGDLVDQTEFSLTNRENMLYPVLLGRNFLRDVALVDVAQKFTQPKYVAPDKVSLQP